MLKQSKFVAYSTPDHKEVLSDAYFHSMISASFCYVIQILLQGY